MEALRAVVRKSRPAARAVSTSADRWIRLDARGNKEGVDARFSLDGEHLAWPVDPSQGEIDYPAGPRVPARHRRVSPGHRPPGRRGLRRPPDGIVTARY
ncbi:hypothetical protein J7E87_28690 [Streptomyces sp. ISL-1]|uniref:hypothetical protein n=1 Tax=Streptomyces sp. ISL-1 TaxID=2817657 RepID=UPI001BE81613|nr:hypothetical protein [Streptomyces sp. ISL-1]MBT2393298.1 hypothetical protein [Streptomyces sp. ISL-1]